MIALDILFLVIGFVLLVKGADYFVDGAAALAKLFNIPTMVIGLTVIAFGTSAPELAVSLSAALAGSNAIAMGNVVGSNIMNFFLILGISAVITTIPATRKILKRDYLISLVAAVSMLVLGAVGMRLGRADGIVFLAAIILYVIMLIKSAKSGKETVEVEDIKSLPPLKCALYIILGLSAVVGGGELVVKGAKNLALALGMTETFVALTVVAFGTSLPELVTSVIAARKGQTDIALGNILGSNIFNLWMILGVSAAVHPIVPTVEMIIQYKEPLFDLALLVIMSLILFVPLYKKEKFTRGTGVFMLVFYGCYFAFIMMRSYGIINLF